MPRTPLHAAAAAGHENIIDMLLGTLDPAGAMNFMAMVDNAGRTAAECAAAGTHLDVVRQLLSAHTKFLHAKEGAAAERGREQHYGQRVHERERKTREIQKLERVRGWDPPLLHTPQRSSAESGSIY